MSRAAFLCPSVLWANPATPSLGDTIGSRPSPWIQSSLFVRDATALVMAADPLITAVHLAGYMPTAAVLGIQSACIRIALDTMSVTEPVWGDALGVPWPAGQSVVFGLYLEPRTTFDGATQVAVDLPGLSSAAAAARFTTKTPGWMLIGSNGLVAIDRFASDALAALRPRLDAATAAVLSDLVAAAGRAATLKSCGLLGIYDPDSWTFAKADRASTALKKIGAKALGVIKDPARLGLAQFLERDIRKTMPGRGVQKLLADGYQDGDYAAGLCLALAEGARTRYQTLHGFIDKGAEGLIAAFPKKPYTQVLMHMHTYGLADLIALDDLALVAREYTDPDVTGRYAQTGAKARGTLQINQAGKYITGRWQRHDGGSVPDDWTAGSMRNFRHFTFTGQLQQDDGAGGLRFLCFGAWDLDLHRTLNPDFQPPASAPEFGDEFEVLTSVNGSTLSLTITFLNGRTEEYVRTRTVALLERSIVTRMSANNPAFRGSQDAPFHPAETAELKRAFDAVLDAMTEYAASTDKWEHRVTVGNLDAALPKLLTPYFDVTSTPMATSEQGVLARLVLKQSMLAYEVPAASGDRRSLWRWFEAAVVENADVGTQRLQAIFELTPNAKNHLYQWTLGAWGPSVTAIAEFAGMVGTMTITKYQGTPEHPTSEEWTQEYWAGFVGIGAGIGEGLEINISDSGWADGPTEWKQQNFVGWFGGAGVQAGAGATPLMGPDVIFWDPVFQAQFIGFNGDGSLKTLGGYSYGQNDIGVGFFAGAELSGRRGYMWMKGQPPLQRTPVDDQPIAALAATPGGTDTHFRIGSATLTDTGRQRLRELCATYRASLQGIGGSLEVRGFASPTGTKEDNLRLSAARAVAVYRAIREILGDALGVTEERTTITGYGEQPALNNGVPDGTESAAWRRVDVLIDGTVASHLWY